MEPKHGEWWIGIVDLGLRQGLEIARWEGERFGAGWQLVDLEGNWGDETFRPLERIDLEHYAAWHDVAKLLVKEP